MPITASRVTVTTDPTSLVAGPEYVPGVKGLDVAVRVPAGGVTVTVGPSNVTTSTGFDLQSGEPLTLNLDPGETLYGVVTSGTQVVHVLTSDSDE